MQSLSGKFVVVAAFVSMFALTAAGGDYIGNRVEDPVSATGGGFSAPGNLTLSGSDVMNNAVAGTAPGATAQGGGLYVGGDLTLSNSNVMNNTVTGPSGATAQGGGLYVVGDLTLTNVNIKGNSVAASGANAQGGGAYVGGSVNLNVTAGRTGTISGNTVNGSNNRNSFHVNSTANGNFNINIGNNAALELLDGLSIVSTGVYDITQSGTGAFVWDGRNTIAAAGGSTVTLGSGAVRLGKDFMLTLMNANDEVHIANSALNAVDEIGFSVGRRPGDALFNFTGGGTMTVEPGATIAPTYGRQITSFTDEYLVAAGLTQANAEAVAGTSGAPGDLKIGSGDRYLYGTSLSAVENAPNDWELWAGVRFSSPFDNSGVNALSARDPLDEVLNGAGARVISDAEYAGILNNARSAHPEAFMEQAAVFMDGVDMASRGARNFGLRSPHRARLRAEGTFARAASDAEAEEGLMRYDTDYGYPITTSSSPAGEYGDEYQGSASAASDFAYPRLVDSVPETFAENMRYWGGYVGEWRGSDAGNGYNGYDSSRHGFLLGANYDFGTAASVGVFAGYTWGTTEGRLADTEVTSDNGHIGAQARFSPIESMQELSFYGDIGYHWSSNDMRRTLGGWSAEGDFGQSAVAFGLGVEHVFTVGGFTIAPYLDLRHVRISQDDMREGGSSVTIAGVDGFDGTGTNTRLGMEFSQEYLFADGTMFAPALNLAWKHEYGDAKFNSSASYLAGRGGMPFGVSSSEIGANSVDLGLALRASRMIGDCNRLGVSLGYNLNFGSGSATHSLQLGAELGF